MKEVERMRYNINKFREHSKNASFDVYWLSLKDYGTKTPMGNKVEVFLNLFNGQGFYKKEYIDFIEDKDYNNVVDELVTEHGNNARIWVVLKEIAF